MSFNFEFNQSHLRELLPGNPDVDKWYDDVVKLLPKYKIDTVERVAGFFAQTGHESLDWTVNKENLNYSASGLNRVFPKYFVRAGVNAQSYHRQPERIANRVYANRMNNGNEASGDGWRYRGRGLIQLTGKYNYQQFSSYTNIPMDRILDYVSTPTGALESACWFWKEHGLNDLADRQDIRGMTRRINGGFHGLDDRKLRYRRALDILDGDVEESTVNTNQVLRMGARGETVRAIQELLDIDADGVFGPATYNAVMRYQSEHGLKPDGILGSITLGKLLG